ncbi:hypothetical protein KB206_08695 [Microvirga sp. STS02]|uniref:hypothetical protein n=1 Tax=Hymenobacter negativus TaxID=2795026 RepID=UPI0018DD0506|nr:MULTISPECIES: hypothetical protein [Bacteria]MBH8568957.1 hypothetical protein [Hymenobacter negativus]MBR7208692.1 hypothetical protein [Microvirga sp. STS02]
MLILARTDFALGTKALIYGATAGFGILAVWDAVGALHEKDFGHLYIITIPLFIACVVGFIYATRHRLELSDSQLVQYGFRSKHIPLEEIKSIEENLGAYEVKSAKTSIRITTDLQNKNLFKDQLIAQIQKIDAYKNQFPGRRLDEADQYKIFEQFQHMVDMGIETETLFNTDASIFEQLTEPAYYLGYEHHIHSFLNRAYDADEALVNLFLKERIETTAASDSSFFIMPHHLEWLILCLSDGRILVKPAKE